MPEPRVGATATVVSGEDDETLVLIAGGRRDFNDLTTNLSNALLYDPATDTVFWSNDDAMFHSRSEHSAIKMATGDVLVVGGITGLGNISDTAEYEIFDPDDQSFTKGSNLTIPPLGFGAVNLGSDGVLLCGGGSPVRDGSDELLYLSPVDTCNKIGLSGKVDSLFSATLPTPLQSFAMARLDEGALISGGIAEDSYPGWPAPSQRKAWVFAYNSWTETDSLTWRR
ncbi:MAG: hypothetical protein HN348_29645, partial [Proteobacteria bacterium]|nr:hypothetical protein [Pseudomonadota bacterium]